MQQLKTQLIAIMALTISALGAHSTALAKGRTSLVVYLEVDPSYTCTELTLTDSDSSVLLSTLLSDMRYRRGQYSERVYLSPGAYTVSGELACDEGTFEVTPLSFTLARRDVLKRTLEVDYSVEEPLPMCDSEEWSDSIAALDADLSSAVSSLQEARYQAAVGDGAALDAALSALSETLSSVEESLADTTVDGVSYHTCAFYACPDAPEVGVERTYAYELWSLTALGLEGVDVADTASTISLIDAALELLSAERVRIGAEYKVLTTATSYQCDYGYEISAIHARQSDLANASSSASVSDADRASLQVEYEALSAEVSRVASAAGCVAERVNGCDEDGVCPSIETLVQAGDALVELAAAMTELTICAP